MNFVEHFPPNTITILDGALATELETKGFDTNTDLWSARALMTNPALLKDIHLEYLRAGATVITTSSYQATLQGFIKYGATHDEAEALIKLSVVIAKGAVDTFVSHSHSTKRLLVAASVGPYGAFLADGSEYRGDYSISFSHLKEFHRDRLRILVSAEPDLLACETIPCLLEAQAIIEELKQYPQCSAWVSFSCKDGKHVSSGELISDCAEWLDKQDQVIAVGVNCTAPEYILSLIQEIKAHTKKPIVVYPNSGERYNVHTKSWEGTRVSYADYLPQWYKAGARIVGGCCRSNPQMIRDLARCAEELER